MSLDGKTRLKTHLIFQHLKSLQYVPYSEKSKPNIEINIYTI